MLSLRLSQFLHTLRHAVDHDPALFWRDAIPFLLERLPQLIDIPRSWFVRGHSVLEETPEILHRVHVGRLRRPRQHREVMLFQPACGFFRRVLRVIVVLEDDILLSQIVVPESLEEFVSEDGGVELGVEASIDCAGVPNALGSQAAPHHERTPAMLDRGLHLGWLKSLAGPSPDVVAPGW